MKARATPSSRKSSPNPRKHTGLQSSIVTLYGGAIYDLYRYKRYTDIRCAFAPEMAVAFFGGDPDNFEYPRYDLDITVLRAYEDDKPAEVQHYLRLSTKGVQENDLVFVSGNPGTTDRLLPVATLKSMRTNPRACRLRLDGLERQERVCLTYSEKGPEERRQAQRRELFGIRELAWKALSAPGLASLSKPDLMDRKTQEELAPCASNFAKRSRLPQPLRPRLGRERSRRATTASSAFCPRTRSSNKAAAPSTTPLCSPTLRTSTRASPRRIG